ncbi:GIY-YIG nuclease family protein [Streptomyces adustus]|uniref:GIY-YIG nuclease family protein n=1 Tax=Streptomyces adustus TaxID=1609272 RepID=UPI003711D7A4
MRASLPTRSGHNSRKASSAAALQNCRLTIWLHNVRQAFDAARGISAFPSSRARGAWTVPQARRVEAELHARLADFRVRKDREFFRMEFRDVARLIEAYVKPSRRITALEDVTRLSERR